LSVVALLLGFIGISVSGVLLATSAGIGTGGGSLGAIVAFLLSLIGAALGGVAVAGIAPAPKAPIDSPLSTVHGQLSIGCALIVDDLIVRNRPP
jgi:hypothetical protein